MNIKLSSILARGLKLAEATYAPDSHKARKVRAWRARNGARQSARAQAHRLARGW